MEKSKRLLKNIDFKQIIELKKGISCASLVLHYRKNELNHGRVGISVSKKNGNAVKRNYFKRQLRALVDELVDFTKPIDYVIIVRNRFTEQDYATNRHDLKKLLEKL